jgi:hypothetical protein
MMNFDNVLLLCATPPSGSKIEKIDFLKNFENSPGGVTG